MDRTYLGPGNVLRSPGQEGRRGGEGTGRGGGADGVVGCYWRLFFLTRGAGTLSLFSSTSRVDTNERRGKDWRKERDCRAPRAGRDVRYPESTRAAPDIEVKCRGRRPGPDGRGRQQRAFVVVNSKIGQKLKRDGAAFPAHPLLLFAREHCVLYGDEYFNVKIWFELSMGPNTGSE